MSCFVIGLLFGPIALSFVAMERLRWVPPPAKVVRDGRAGPGSVDLLVVTGARQDHSAARAGLRRFTARLGRLTLARVLPEGGPGEDTAVAAESLEEEARQLGAGGAGLVLLFGRPDETITRFAESRRFSVVVTARQDPELGAALAGAGVRHLFLADAGRPVAPSRTDAVSVPA